MTETPHHAMPRDANRQAAPRRKRDKAKEVLRTSKAKEVLRTDKAKEVLRTPRVVFRSGNGISRLKRGRARPGECIPAALWTTTEWDGSSFQKSNTGRYAAFLATQDSKDTFLSLFLPILGTVSLPPSAPTTGELSDRGNHLQILLGRHCDSLHERIGSRTNSMAPIDRLRLALTVCRGLCLLFDNDIPYEDLSLYSILMDEANQYRLAPPGLSNLLVARPMDVFHAAPEFLAGSVDTDAPGSDNLHASTVYSFGVLLWELLLDTKVETLFVALAEFRSSNGSPSLDQFRSTVGEGSFELPLPRQALLVQPRLAKLLRSCCHPTPSKRPSLPDVYQRLTDAVLHLLIPHARMRKAWRRCLDKSARITFGSSKPAGSSLGIFQVQWDLFVQYYFVDLLGVDLVDDVEALVERKSEDEYSLAIIALHAAFATGYGDSALEMRAKWVDLSTGHLVHHNVESGQPSLSLATKKALNRDLLAAKGVLTTGRGGILSLENLIMLSQAFPHCLASGKEDLAGVRSLMVDEPLFLPVRTATHAVRLLRRSRPSTFFFRFDEVAGCFAVSYVLNISYGTREVRHFRFARCEDDGHFLAVLPAGTARRPRSRTENVLTAYSSLKKLRLALVRESGMPLARHFRPFELFAVHDAEATTYSQGDVGAKTSEGAVDSGYRFAPSLLQFGAIGSLRRLPGVHRCPLSTSPSPRNNELLTMSRASLTAAILASGSETETYYSTSEESSELNLEVGLEEEEDLHYSHGIPSELRHSASLAPDAVLRPSAHLVSFEPAVSKMGLLSDRKGTTVWVECHDGVFSVYDFVERWDQAEAPMRPSRSGSRLNDRERTQRPPSASLVLRLCVVLDGCRVITKKSETRFKLCASSWKRSFVSERAADISEWVQVLTKWASFSELLHDYGSFAPVRPPSRAQWLVDGCDVFSTIAEAIDAAQRTVLITGWWFTPHVYLRRGSGAAPSDRLDKTLQAAAGRGVQVYVMLWDEVSFAVKCVASAEVCKRLTALHENIHTLRHPPHILKWSHHQKTVVVDFAVAFVGGVDLCVGRWDTPFHTLRDDNHLHPRWPGSDYYNPEYAPLIADLVTKPFKDQMDRDLVPRFPWHDVHLCVDGAAAWDVGANFVQRWNHHSRSAVLDHVTPVQAPVISSVSPSPRLLDVFSGRLSPTCECQVLRSLSSWSGGHRTERSIMNAYIDLIDNAQHFVYLENQFFISSTGGSAISNQVAQALVSRIRRAHEAKETFRAMIVLPAYPEGHFATHADVRCLLFRMYDTVCRGKRSILSQLAALDIDHHEFITFHTLRQWDVLHGGRCVTNQIYVHSKMMIVDDRAALIGSANINDRSLLGDRDSEIAILVRDTKMLEGRMNGEPFAVAAFAHSLRVALMAEHLGVIIPPACDPSGPPRDKVHPVNLPAIEQLVDPVHADSFHRLWKATSRRNSMVYEAVFPFIPSNSITTLAKFKEAEALGERLWAEEADIHRALLQRVQGHVIDLPRQFLKDQSVSAGVEDLHLKLLHDVQDSVFL